MDTSGGASRSERYTPGVQSDEDSPRQVWDERHQRWLQASSLNASRAWLAQLRAEAEDVRTRPMKVGWFDVEANKWRPTKPVNDLAGSGELGEPTSPPEDH